MEDIPDSERLRQLRAELQHARDEWKKADADRREIAKHLEKVYSEATPEQIQEWSETGPPRIDHYGAETARNRMADVEASHTQLTRRVWQGVGVALLAGLGGNVVAAGLDHLWVRDAVAVGVGEMVLGTVALAGAVGLALGYLGRRVGKDEPRA